MLTSDRLMKSLRCRFDSEFNAIRRHPTPLVYASPTAMLWAMQAKRNGRIAQAANNSLRNSLVATLHLAAQPTAVKPRPNCPAVISAGAIGSG